jgi:diguanylate cyclase (GGDEF)-like protein
MRSNIDRGGQRSPARRRHVLHGAAVLSFLLTLGLLAAGIQLTHERSRHEIVANLKARAMTTAAFAATLLSEQAVREESTAERFLAGRARPTREFERVVTTFGSGEAVLLDGSGRLLDVLPSGHAQNGTRIAPRYAYLTRAEQGHIAISGVVRSVALARPVVAIAVPFSTPAGRRVFSVAYPVAGSVLAALVGHTISYPQHLVALVDASGRIAAASPYGGAATLAQASPTLAAAVAHAPHGDVSIAGAHSTFVLTPVAGTPWRLVIAVPNSRLFMTARGWALWLPWIVFAVIAALGSVVLVLLSRSLAAHARLQALSAQLEQAARTDPVTGLANRRALEERLAQASAYANRYDEPLSALAIDLDLFKEINDGYGHETGDEVLRAVSECMRDVFRDSDIFGRWGGDEFLAILPGTGEEATLAGERLCAAVSAIDCSRFGVVEPVTVSVGCASAHEVSPRVLLVAADDSLYEAKRAGRGRVIA